MLTVELGGHHFWLDSDTPEGIEQLHKRFGPFICDNRPTEGGAYVRLSNSGHPPKFRIFRREAPVPLSGLLAGPLWQSLHPSATRPGLYDDAQFNAVGVLEGVEDEIVVRCPEYWPSYVLMGLLWLTCVDCRTLLLHSAVIVVGDHAAVLIAPSGAGKSTLAWASHLAGAGYLGDELSFFSIPGYELRVLPVSARLRPGATRLLGVAPERLVWRETKVGDPKAIMSIPTPVAGHVPHRVSLVFLDGFGESPLLQPLSGSEAIRRILDSMAFGDMRVATRLEVAAGLINSHATWRLVSGTPGQTAERLISHLERTA